MHPAIRAFPSRYFYSDRLTDAPAVTALPDEPYHADPLLRPLLFFDVSAGRESHGERSVSYQNTTEAALAVALFQRLQEVSVAAGATGPVPVGVVTPYRQQLKLLRRSFDHLARSAPPPSLPLPAPPAVAAEQAAGNAAPIQVQQQQQQQQGQGGPDPGSAASQEWHPALLAAPPPPCASAAAAAPRAWVAAVAAGGAALYVNTVDAFQGQERDAIILSCVRASTRGLGFVADVRRMNVAITRAKRSLWILGNAASLQRSPAWAALIDDAKQRGCFLSSDSFAPTLLPSLASTAPHRSSPPRRHPPHRHSPRRFAPSRNNFGSGGRRGEEGGGAAGCSSGAAGDRWEQGTGGSGVPGLSDGRRGEEVGEERSAWQNRHEGTRRGGHRQGHGHGHGHGHGYRGGHSRYNGQRYAGSQQANSHEGAEGLHQGEALPPRFEGQAENGRERDWKRRRLDNKSM
ncbi:unnamed protein product [Closterium sp. NIES-53]